jgi:hypothetical protein
MAGRKHRSGGHNRLSPEQHLLRNTWNVTRHGPRPSSLALAAAPRVEPMPATLLVGLEARGRTFVTSCWESYNGWSPPKIELLHEAGRLLDALGSVRGRPAERVAQRTLLATLTALQLRD